MVETDEIQERTDGDPGTYPSGQRETSALLFSVVICTHNRADLLRSVLDSLCGQALHPASFEVLVVDNGSTDQTRETVLAYTERPLSVRYCYEPTLGHAPARNRGWQEAMGAYIAYIDDDALAPSQWLSTAAARCLKHDHVGIFGGPYYADYRFGKAAWFKDAYGSSQITTTARALTATEFLSATNFFVRRSLLAEIGGFDCAYGGAGTNLGYAEETELQQRIRRRMPDEIIFYEPRLYVFHLVKPQRMSLLWRMRSSFVMGRYHHRFLASQRLRNASLVQTLGMMLWRTLTLIGLLTLGALLRDRTRHPYWMNYAYEKGPRYCRMLGGYYEHLRLLRNK